MSRLDLESHQVSRHGIRQMQVELSLAREALTMARDLSQRLADLGFNRLRVLPIAQRVRDLEAALTANGAGMPLVDAFPLVPVGEPEPRPQGRLERQVYGQDRVVEAYRKSQAEDGDDLRGRMI